MDIKQLFITTSQSLCDIIDQVQVADLDKLVPQHMAYADGQTLRTTVNVLAYENDCVPRMLAGEKDLVANDSLTTNYLDGDYHDRYRQLTASANAAVNSCDLEATVYMSYATVPARQYLNDIIIQRSTAVFDIAQLVGLRFQWSDELVQALWDVTEPYAPTLREYGVFPAQVTVPETASPQDKLVALTGRQP